MMAPNFSSYIKTVSFSSNSLIFFLTNQNIVVLYFFNN